MNKMERGRHRIDGRTRTNENHIAQNYKKMGKYITLYIPTSSSHFCRPLSGISQADSLPFSSLL